MLQHTEFLSVIYENLVEMDEWILWGVFEVWSSVIHRNQSSINSGRKWSKSCCTCTSTEEGNGKGHFLLWSFFAHLLLTRYLHQNWLIGSSQNALRALTLIDQLVRELLSNYKSMIVRQREVPLSRFQLPWSALEEREREIASLINFDLVEKLPF